MARFVCPGCGEVLEVDGVDRVAMRREHDYTVLPGRVSIMVGHSLVHSCAEGAYLT